MTKVRTRSNSASSSVPVSKQVKIQFQDEGVNLWEKGTVDVVNFVGSAVSVARVGDTIVITITGGGGGGTPGGVSDEIQKNDGAGGFGPTDLYSYAFGYLSSGGDLHLEAAGSAATIVLTTAGAIVLNGTTLSAFISTLLDDATAAAARATLGVEFQRNVKGTTPNRLLTPAISSLANSTQATAVNTLRAFPFIVETATTYDLIVAEVTALVGGSSIRLGIYSDDGSGYPDALQVDSGALSGASVAVISAAIALTLQPGLYYRVQLADGNITMRSIGVGAADATILGRVATLGTTPRAGFYTVAQTYGALPATFPAGATINAAGNDVTEIGLRPV